MKKILNWLKKHRIAAIIAIAVVAGGAYYYQSSGSKSADPTYITTPSAKGTIIVSISGSGQVSAENQVELKSQVNGNIIEIKAKNGQAVKTGDIIAEIDKTDLRNQLKQAQTSVAIASANLNEKLAGLTKDELSIAKKSLESSKLSLQNAQIALDNAKKTSQISLEKARLQYESSKTAYELAQKQYQTSLATNENTSQSTSQSLKNAYDNAKPGLNSALVALRTALNFADSVIGIDKPMTAAYKDYLGALNAQSVIDARNSYYSAKNSLLMFENDFNRFSSSMANDEVDTLLISARKALEDMKSLEHNIYILLNNSVASKNFPQATLDSYKSSASSQESAMVSAISSNQSSAQSIASAKLSSSSSGISLESSTNSAQATLESAKNSYEQAKQTYEQSKLDNNKSVQSAEADLKAKRISYDSAQADYNSKVAPPRSVDIASLQAQVSQALNTLGEAEDNLKYATIKSPIDGIIAKMNVSIGDAISDTVSIATLVTEQKIAEVSLNEVDAAKVKPGQKATLTFNAIEGLSISGTVADIDMLGTVSQNVVTYSARIALDTQDSRVKPEMSVNADIITDLKADILLVPSSAIKTSGSRQYVEVLDNLSEEQKAAAQDQGIVMSSSPRTAYIETGLANDSETEVTSGLSENEQVVVETIAQSSSSAAANSQQQSGLQLFGGGNRGGGGSAGAIRRFAD